MTADDLVTYVTWAIYILVFILAAVQAVRYPLRANIDIALLFFLPASIVAIRLATRSGLLATSQLLSAITIGLVLAMPYMLLRLAHDFANVPNWVMRVVEVWLGVMVVVNFVLSPPLPPWLLLLEMAYLIALLVYVTIRLTRESQRSSGVTKRRLRAVAVGSLGLGAVFLIAGIGIALPDVRPLLRPLSEAAALTSAVSYFLGFSTPTLLRRAWQEPELRAFLGRAARLPRLPSTAAIIAELETGAASSLGAPHASIGLWDEDAQVLRFTIDGEPLEIAPTSTLPAGRAFVTQEAVFTPRVSPDIPQLASKGAKLGVRAVMAAPITADDKRLGVLTAYAPRAPIFAHEDLRLLHLLADQAAVILESRALIDEAARVKVREEVTRIKEDFLSSAAHDLRTPLTILVTQTELLERRALRNPDAPADIVSLQRLKREVFRLKNLVLELLDAARAEQGRLVGERVELDLVESAVGVCTRHGSETHACEVVADGRVVGMYDPTRIEQLVGNLVENAVKYSPDGGSVKIKVWSEAGWNRLSVTDQGIGIPSADLPHVFERFHRGSNVDDRRFAGMGLGLYICLGIVEEHGGSIWVESASSESGAKDNGRSQGGEYRTNVETGTGENGSGRTGTTFHLALPPAVALMAEDAALNSTAGARAQA